jgi:hypothetical protein
VYAIHQAFQPPEILGLIWRYAFEGFVFSMDSAAVFDIASFKIEESKLFGSLAPALLSSISLETPTQSSQDHKALAFYKLLARIQRFAGCVKTVSVCVSQWSVDGVEQDFANARPLLFSCVGLFPAAHFHFVCENLYSNPLRLCDWVKSFPAGRLGQLTLMYVQWPPDVGHHVSGVTKLVLQNVRFRGPEETQRFLASFPALRSLHSRFSGMSQTFLRYVAADLEELEYDSNGLSGTCDLPLYRDAGRLASLRRLHLSSTVCGTERAWEDALRCLPPALSQLRLTLYDVGDDLSSEWPDDQFRAFPYHAVATVLKDAGWLPQLRELHVGGMERVDVEEVVLEDLCKARGGGLTARSDGDPGKLY